MASATATENPALKGLRDQVNAEAAAAQAATDPEVAAKHIAAANGFKSQYDLIVQNEANLAALKSWDTVPATALPGFGSGGPGGSADATATKSAGTTEIDLLTGKVVDETGSGVLTRHQMKAIANKPYLDAYRSYLRQRGIENMKSSGEVKSLSEGIDTEGGFFVPAEMLAGILRREPAPTQLLDMVRKVNVSSDRATMLRSIYDADDLYTSSVRVYKTAEGAAATETGKPLFGTFNIDVHQFTAEFSISRLLLEDTAFDIIGFMTDEIRTAVRNFLADKILNGTGVGEHYGILTRAGTADGPDTINTGHASQITWAGFRKLKNAVPEQYDANSKFFFNKKSTQDALEALVDNNGRPLWPESQRSGLEAGVPGTLQGYGYAREARMPDIAANKLVALFGDPTAYIEATRLGMSIEPLREIAARQGMVVFLCRFRDGGDIAEKWKMKALKVAA